jgi:hypothetical protein
MSNGSLAKDQSQVRSALLLHISPLDAFVISQPGTASVSGIWVNQNDSSVLLRLL